MSIREETIFGCKLCISGNSFYEEINIHHKRKLEYFALLCVYDTHLHIFLWNFSPGKE
jgi:hypothetical protein